MIYEYISGSFIVAVETFAAYIGSVVLLQPKQWRAVGLAVTVENFNFSKRYICSIGILSQS